MPDAVVIGAGPNGLVAANLLADAGWSVEVLEEQPEPGGAVRHDRSVDPDFVNDLFSSFYPLAVSSPSCPPCGCTNTVCAGATLPASWRIPSRTAGVRSSTAGST